MRRLPTWGLVGNKGIEWGYVGNNGQENGNYYLVVGYTLGLLGNKGKIVGNIIHLFPTDHQ